MTQCSVLGAQCECAVRVLGRGGGRVDREYRRMMTWVAIALAASGSAALVIVEVGFRRYGSQGGVDQCAGSNVTTVVRSDGKYLLKASLTEATLSALMRSTRVAMIAGSCWYRLTALNRASQYPFFLSESS